MSVRRTRRAVSARAVFALAVASLAGGGAASAQAKRPLSLVSLAEIPRVQDAQLSPDGRFVSYMLARADWSANRLVAHLWRQATTGGSPSQVTAGETGESLGRWSPDSRTLLYIARADNGAQVFLVPAQGGPSRQLTHHATSVYGAAPPVWAPDGTAIYFLASDPATGLERERARLRDDVRAFREDDKPRRLWKVTVADGVEQPLTSGTFSVLSFRISRDGGTIVEHRAPSPLDDDSLQSEVWLTDASGRNPRRVTNNSIDELEAELSPDNSTVLFLSESNARLEPYFPSSLFVVPVAGGPPTLLLPDFPYSIDHASWSPDGRTILAVVNVGVHSEIFRIDVAARKAAALTDGRHSTQFWSLSPSAGRMVFQRDEPTRLGDVWTLPVEGGTPARVTGVYDALDREFELPRQERFAWKSADGTAIEGLLFYPPDYRAGTRYPVVVQLHGGPVDSDKFGYGPGVVLNYVPVLTAKGYVVFRVNYRGSAGYGSAFLRDVLGGYFKNMHLDVMAGVDALVRDGIADPDRLAVMGWSAGGHLTNKLITFTTRFKAASSAAGVANWVSFLAETDTRTGRSDWFNGLPWGKDAVVETAWNSSPIKDAANVKTPTLLLAGEGDERVPLAQSVEMYRALLANGVTTGLYLAPREPHQWGELRHQLYKANLELEWFDRYVNGRTYTWERAPGDPAGP